MFCSAVRNHFSNGLFTSAREYASDENLWNHLKFFWETQQDTIILVVFPATQAF